QAEDGIRDFHVTGVQTCALPIFDFTSQIDTLKNSVKKTILLKSSKFTKLEGVPKEISLDVVTEEPQPETFTSGEQNLAVLLEGRSEERRVGKERGSRWATYDNRE